MAGNRSALVAAGQRRKDDQRKFGEQRVPDVDYFCGGGATRNVLSMPVSPRVRSVAITMYKAHLLLSPVDRYEGQGIAHPVLGDNERKHHAIIHADHRRPQLLDIEQEWQNTMKGPVPFRPAEQGGDLEPAARLRLDTQCVVTYKSRVRDIGSVLDERQLRDLIYDLDFDWLL